MSGDLISREALMELARNHVGHVVDCNDIARFPAVDAVPVVRCSECVHRGLPACPMCHDESYYDEDDGAEYYTVDKTDGNGFCHIGAKMDEEA